jgi:hypothetical protein
MKKIFSIITACTLAISCGFLEENPTTQLGDEVAYGSEGALEAQTYGIIRAFNGSYMITGNMLEGLQSCSGLIHWGCAPSFLSDAEQRWTCSFSFTQYERNPFNYESYTGFYKVISKANQLIEHLPGSPVDEGLKKAFEAEARFYRALAHYYLVRAWGDVPLRRKTVTDYADASAPRAPFWEVYAFIVEDLKFAFEHMPKTASTAAGRPSNYAAQALLSQVYLTIGTLTRNSEDNFWDSEKRTPDFSLIFKELSKDSPMEDVSKKAFGAALEAAEDVINNGPYMLAPKYGDLFRWTEPQDWTLPERIFVITNTPESSSSASNYTALRSLPKFPEGTQNFTSKNSNYGRWRPTRFVYQKWCETYGGVMGAGANNKNVYEYCGDPRFDITLWHHRYIIQENGGKFEYTYPDDTRVFYKVNNKDTEPFFKKYLDPTYDANSGRADFYLLRFAEVYLIAAEAAANLSQQPGDNNWLKAFDHIETIHARARKSVPDGEPESDWPKWEEGRFLSDADPTESLINAIFWERVYELYGEGHEFYDTHRMGATWLAENIAKPIVDFLLLPEQQIDSYSAAAPGTASYCMALYGSNTPPQLTNANDLRGSLLLEFPQKEVASNHAITLEDAANDFPTIRP